MNTNPAKRDDVVRLFGDITDHTVVEILQTGATLEQLEEVSMWMAQEDDVMGEARRPLTGVPAQILDWVEREQVLPGDED